MFSFSDDASFVEYVYFICRHSRRDTLRTDYLCFSFYVSVQFCAQSAFRKKIQSGKTIVENIYTCIPEYRTRNHHSLFLSAGKVCAALFELMIQTVGVGVHIASDFGYIHSIKDLFTRGVSVSEKDIFRNTLGKYRGTLQHARNIIPYRRGIKSFIRNTVIKDISVGRLIKPEKQPQDRTFSRTRTSDESYSLAVFYINADVFEYILVAVRIFETYVFKIYVSAERNFFVRDFFRGICLEDLIYPHQLYADPRQKPLLPAARAIRRNI